MADFKGYLLKAAGKSNIFPHDYMAIKSWKGSPNNRREIKAYMDDYTQNLTRIPANGLKSTFSFETMDDLNLAAIEEIKEFFDAATTNAQERKVYLEYWNQEELQYKTGYFYRPNTEFPINSISENDILHGPAFMEFIEY